MRHRLDGICVGVVNPGGDESRAGGVENDMAKARLRQESTSNSIANVRRHGAEGNEIALDGRLEE